jgi:hypothetical protein
MQIQTLKDVGQIFRDSVFLVFAVNALIPVQLPKKETDLF